jgi:hypothetical protein
MVCQDVLHYTTTFSHLLQPNPNISMCRPLRAVISRVASSGPSMKVTNCDLFANLEVENLYPGLLGTTDQVSCPVRFKDFILELTSVIFVHDTGVNFSGKASSFEEEDGTGTGKNEVRIKLGRGDLSSQFSCQAENEAIDQPLSTSVQVDVNRKSKLGSSSFFA